MILGLGGAVPNIDLQSIVDGENNLKVLIPTSKFEGLILSLLMDITLTLSFFSLSSLPINCRFQQRRLFFYHRGLCDLNGGKSIFKTRG